MYKTHEEKKKDFDHKLKRIVRDECRKPITSRDNISEYKKYYDSMFDLNIKNGYIYDPEEPDTDSFAWVNEFILDIGMVPTVESLKELKVKTEDYHKYVTEFLSDDFGDKNIPHIDYVELNLSENYNGVIDLTGFKNYFLKTEPAYTRSFQENIEKIVEFITTFHIYPTGGSLETLNCGTLYYLTQFTNGENLSYLDFIDKIFDLYDLDIDNYRKININKMFDKYLKGIKITRETTVKTGKENLGGARLVEIEVDGKYNFHIDSLEPEIHENYTENEEAIKKIREFIETTSNREPYNKRSYSQNLLDRIKNTKTFTREDLPKLSIKKDIDRDEVQELLKALVFNDIRESLNEKELEILESFGLEGSIDKMIDKAINTTVREISNHVEDRVKNILGNFDIQ
jgi:hypothetical protein